MSFISVKQIIAYSNYDFDNGRGLVKIIFNCDNDLNNIINGEVKFVEYGELHFEIVCFKVLYPYDLTKLFRDSAIEANVIALSKREMNIKLLGL